MNAKAAFCGRWRLDVARSRFGFLPPPHFREDTLLVSEEHIRIETLQADDRGEFRVLRDVAAGAAPATIDVRGQQRWCQAWWEGTELVMVQQWEQGGNPRKVIDRRRLLERGRQMLLERENVQKGGNVRQTLYFHRVDEAATVRRDVVAPPPPPSDTELPHA